MKIKAAVLFAPQTPFKMETLDLQGPQKGEVLVKMEAAGVCHSDWHLVTGDSKHPMPLVAGHEGAGIVAALGEGVTGLKVGDKVSLNWANYCGECYYCKRGRPGLCETFFKTNKAGFMPDGTSRLSLNGEPVRQYCALACFADHAVVPRSSCVKMPDAVPSSVAAAIGCAVTTGVGSVLNTAQVEPDASIAVFGAGGVGLCTVMGAKLAGARSIIAIDPLESRLEAAKSFGATHGLQPSDSVIDQIFEITEGRGADYVFEAAGSSAVQELAIKAARRGGTVVFSGLSPVDSTFPLSGALLVRQEKAVMGSYYGTAIPHEDFPKFGDLYLKGQLPIDRLITRSYPLEQINEAYADMLSGAITRGILRFD
ncbi:MAG: Zn-dependent alcohol dehydrogenase [Armatimonadetes bacterium]|nr:Zn-dependent alcohol dehydrogenase [Armatimonadota bacterium]